MERVLLVLASLAVAGMGCTQNDSVGGGEFVFDLPVVTFSVSSDPNDPRWRPVPPDGIPDVLCRGPAAITDDCCHAPSTDGSLAPTISVDCRQYPLGCDAAGWCALVFDYDEQRIVDLGEEVPALQERRGWVLASADLAVFNADVNLPSRLPIESAALYVAPQGVLSHKAPESRFVMSIPLVEDSEMKKPGRPVSVALDADARFALSAFLADFNSPFTLILSARVAIETQHTKAERAAAALSPEEIQTATFTISGAVRASF